MGYSKNLATFRKMEADLQLLASLTPCRWERPLGDADNFAYKIREALSIASLQSKRNPSDSYFFNLAFVRRCWEIRVISDYLIEAAPGVDAELSSKPEPMQPSNLPAGKPNILGEVKSAEDVMAFWQKLQPSNDKIHFPQALLSEPDLLLVADWAASLTPSWMVLRPKGTNSLTLAPDDPRVPDAAKVQGKIKPLPRQFPRAKDESEIPTIPDKE